MNYSEFRKADPQNKMDELIDKLHMLLKEAIPVLEPTPKGEQPIIINNGIAIWPFRVIKKEKIFRTIVVSMVAPPNMMEVIFCRAIAFGDDEEVSMKIDNPLQLVMEAEECSKKNLLI